MKDEEAVKVSDLVEYLLTLDQKKALVIHQGDWNVRNHPNRTPIERIVASRIFTDSPDYVVLT